MTVKTLTELVNEKLAERAAERAAQDAFLAEQPAREQAAAAAFSEFVRQTLSIALDDDATVVASELGNRGRDFRITMHVPTLGHVVTDFYFPGDIDAAMQVSGWLAIHNGVTGESFEHLVDTVLFGTRQREPRLSPGESFEHLVDAVLWLFERSSAGVPVEWPELAEA